MDSAEEQGALANIGAFSDALKAVAEILRSYGNRGLVIGGIAVSLLAKPRLTADIDAMLLMDIEDIPDLIKLAAASGLQPRITDAVGFAEQSRVLLLHHTSGVNVDISLGMLPFEEEAVQRARMHQAGSVSLPLPTPEDLIILKAIAHRPKDLADIQSVLQAYPNLDKKRIEKWVREFADALETPELWLDIAPSLAKK